MLTWRGDAGYQAAHGMEGAGTTGEDTVHKRTESVKERSGTFFLGVEHIKMNMREEQELQNSFSHRKALRLLRSLAFKDCLKMDFWAIFLNSDERKFQAVVNW